MSTLADEQKILEEDFRELMATIAHFSDKHRVAKPTLIFPLEWRKIVQAATLANYQTVVYTGMYYTEMYYGVSFRFGTVRKMEGII